MSGSRRLLTLSAIVAPLVVPATTSVPGVAASVAPSPCGHRVLGPPGRSHAVLRVGVRHLAVTVRAGRAAGTSRFRLDAGRDGVTS
ncbi:MAG: hypothetical protein IE926_17940 [Micrococcales bacterium]|nr:hypothetical protein [Micrococcales bacterium]